MRILLAVACLAALAGCAGFNTPDCGSDWYAVGRRDGLIGAPWQHENYERYCGDAVNAVRYREGWRDGSGRTPSPA